MSTYGVDMYLLDDVEFDRPVSDVDLVMQDIYWRLQTKRGMGILFEDAPDYGIDIHSWLGQAMTPAKLLEISAVVRAEILKDERVSDARVTATYTGGPNGFLTVTIVGVTGAGPFELVLKIDAVTVEILKAKGAE